jgi:hypothetical protein
MDIYTITIAAVSAVIGCVAAILLKAHWIEKTERCQTKLKKS